MTTAIPVPRWKIDRAKTRGLANVESIATACREAGVPFYVACALIQKESGGRNVYGHDAGGALAGFDLPVNQHNFAVFRWLVIENGHASNGVGPAQITYAGRVRGDGSRDGGYFRKMEAEGLNPWNPHDNILTGLKILKGHRDKFGSWRDAGTAYNGSEAYGIDLEKRIADWKKFLTNR